MKKLLTILLTVLLSISLFGCGSKKSIIGTWYQSEQGITWDISNKKLTASDDNGNKEEYELTIMDNELILQKNGGSLTIKYELSEDGNTTVLSYDGDDIMLTRK